MCPHRSLGVHRLDWWVRRKHTSRQLPRQKQHFAWCRRVYVHELSQDISFFRPHVSDAFQHTNPIKSAGEPRQKRQKKWNTAAFLLCTAGFVQGHSARNAFHFGRVTFRHVFFFSERQVYAAKLIRQGNFSFRIKKRQASWLLTTKEKSHLKKSISRRGWKMDLKPYNYV